MTIDDDQGLHVTGCADGATANATASFCAGVFSGTPTLLIDSGTVTTGSVISGKTVFMQEDTVEVQGSLTVTGAGGVLTAPLAGSWRGLYNESINSSTSCTVTALDATLVNSSGVGRRYTSISEVIAITSSGANGLDTGSEQSSKFYYIWLIGKADGTIDGLLSLSSTSPTLPSGYTFRLLVGVVRNDSNGNFIPFTQTGNMVYTSSSSGYAEVRVLQDVKQTTRKTIHLGEANTGSCPPISRAAIAEISIDAGLTGLKTASVIFYNTGGTEIAQYTLLADAEGGTLDSTFTGTLPIGAWQNLDYATINDTQLTLDIIGYVLNI